MPVQSFFRNMVSPAIADGNIISVESVTLSRNISRGDP